MKHRVNFLWMSCIFLAASAAAPAGEAPSLSAPIDFFPPDGSPDAIELADVDLDGTLDAVVLVEATADYVCYRGAGDGTFAGAITSGGLYLQPTDLTVGDFNGDGLPDIAAINNACG